LVVRRVEKDKEVVSIFPTKILLATDGSEEATLAADVAADIAVKTGSELHIILVGLPTDYLGVGEPLVTDIFALSEEELKEINDERQQLLDTQVKQIKAAKGIVAQAHLEIGKPDEEIIALGEKIGAGLIALGSRGLGSLERALMGSVSDLVVRHASSPVLVVREEKRY
jgi:nucleotide-binding universal stress UspA family protein